MKNGLKTIVPYNPIAKTAVKTIAVISPFFVFLDKKNIINIASTDKKIVATTEKPKPFNCIVSTDEATAEIRYMIAST